jgi:hypothetical protein
MTYFRSMKRNNLIYALGAFLILGISTENCSRGKELERMRENLSSVQLDKTKFERTVNMQGQEIASQRQVIASKDEAILLGLEQIKGLKNIKNQVKVVTTTEFDTIYATLETDTNELGEITSKFNYTEEWLSFKGEVLDSGVSISDLSIKNEYTLTIADKKLGFFKKPEPTIMLINKNPYTKVEGMTNIAIKQTQPFYKRPWVWLTLGATSGILISKL